MVGERATLLASNLMPPYSWSECPSIILYIIVKTKTTFKVLVFVKGCQTTNASLRMMSKKRATFPKATVMNSKPTNVLNTKFTLAFNAFMWWRPDNCHSRRKQLILSAVV